MPTGPLSPSPVPTKVATPAALVVAVAVPTKVTPAGVPVMVAEMIAPGTGLFEASRSSRIGCWVKACPLLAIVEGCWL